MCHPPVLPGLCHSGTALGSIGGSCCRRESETSAACEQTSSLRHHLKQTASSAWLTLLVLPSIISWHRWLCRNRHCTAGLSSMSTYCIHSDSVSKIHLFPTRLAVRCVLRQDLFWDKWTKRVAPSSSCWLLVFSSTRVLRCHGNIPAEHLQKKKPTRKGLKMVNDNRYCLYFWTIKPLWLFTSCILSSRIMIMYFKIQSNTTYEYIDSVIYVWYMLC